MFHRVLFRHQPEEWGMARTLAGVPAKLLMEAPSDGNPVAENYPMPIVDHSTERQITLELFKKHREQQI